MGKARQDNLIQVLENIPPVFRFLGNFLGKLIENLVGHNAGQDVSTIDRHNL